MISEFQFEVILSSSPIPLIPQIDQPNCDSFSLLALCIAFIRYFCLQIKKNPSVYIVLPSEKGIFCLLLLLLLLLLPEAITKYSQCTLQRNNTYTSYVVVINI